MKPSLSVLMAIYNQEKYLPLALKSLETQTQPAQHHVFVNDASTDNSLKILKSFSLSHIVISLKKRYGLAKALNRGLSQINTRYFARMDADDIAYPQRFSTQLSFLEKNPQFVVCGTAATLIDKNGQHIGTRRYPQNPSSVIMQYNPIIHPSVMMRTETIKANHGYNELLNGAEDYDLWLRLNRKYSLINLDDSLLKYRINPYGVSWSQLKQVETQALKARLIAICNYHYPKWQLIYMLKPALSLLIPSVIKKNHFGIK